MSKKKKNVNLNETDNTDNTETAAVTENINHTENACNAVNISPKKKSKSKKIGLIIVFCALAAVGAIAGTITYKKMDVAKRNVYMALQYLEMSDNNMTVACLDKNDGIATKKVSFAKEACELVRLHVIGNDAMAKIKADAMSRKYKLDDDMSFIVNYVIEGKFEEGHAPLVKLIKDQLNLSEKTEAKYKAIFDIENSAMNGGYLSEESRAKYTELMGKESAIDLALSVSLSNNNYSAAFNEAVQLLVLHPNQENRLMVADIAARAAYSGTAISLGEVCSQCGIEYNQDAINKEYAKKQEKVIKLNAEIDTLNMKLEIETNEDKALKYSQKVSKMQKEVDELQNEIDNPVLYRALNGIVNIPTTEAQVIKAKVYYAMGQEEKAERLMKMAATTTMMLFNTNESMENGLSILHDIYATNGSEGITENKTEQINKLFLTTARDSVVVVPNASYNYSNSLMADMTSSIVSEYKYNNNSVYVSNVDASEYPKISVAIAGKEDIMNAIAKKKNVTVKDTRSEVSYEAEVETGVSTSICFVVDVSGSMDGNRIVDARAALLRFADTCAAGTEVALVQFSDVASIVLPATTNIAAFRNAVNNLYAGGGTEITAGLRTGLEACKGMASSNIIIMTDGESYFDYAAIDEAKAANATVFTIGFGSAEVQLLTDIATSLNGTFTLADSSKDLSAVYASLGAIIGNKVTLKYTVTENTDELDRNFFIKLDDFSASELVNYSVGDEAIGNDLASSFFVKSYWVINSNSSTIDGDHELGYTVSSPSQVVSVEINGKTYPVENPDYSGITLSDELSEGAYPVTFVLTDGSKYTAENNLLVVDASKQNSHRDYVNAHIGSIHFYSNSVYFLSNGEIYANGVELKNYSAVTGKADASLDVIMTGIVKLEPASNVRYNLMDNNFEDWGDSLELSVDGQLYINAGDAQKTPSGNSVNAVTTGKITVKIDASQCTIERR